MKGFRNGGQVPATGNEKTPQQVIEELRAEVAQLRAWKAESLKVMPDFQAIGQALGLPLGSLVSGQILPGIEKLKADKEVLKAQNVERASELIRLKAQLQEKDLIIHGLEEGAGEWQLKCSDLQKDKSELWTALNELQGYCINFCRNYNKTEMWARMEALLDREDMP